MRTVSDRTKPERHLGQEDFAEVAGKSGSMLTPRQLDWCKPTACQPRLKVYPTLCRPLCHTLSPAVSC
jgi:hypothetical protein